MIKNLGVKYIILGHSENRASGETDTMIKQKVELALKNNFVVIVDDDGPGIPVNQYKNVFKPFYRLDKGRNLNHSGVGLGLSIAEDIVRSHGGNIQLGDSKYKGLQVKISLPF